MIITNKATT